MRGRAPLLLLAAPLLLACGPTSDIVTVDRGWEYRFGASPVDSDGEPTWRRPDATGVVAPDWQRLAALDLPPRPEEGATTLWLRVRTPAHPATDPALLLPLVIGVLDVWVDGAQVLEAEPHARGWRRVHLVPLPAGEQEVVLRVRSEHWLTGLRGPARLGSGPDIVREQALQGIGPMALVSVLLVVGAVALIAMRLAGARRMIGFFAVYALGSAGYTLFQTTLAHLLWPDFPGWLDVWAVSVALLPIGVIGLLETLYARGPRDPLRIARIAHVALLVLQLIASYGFGPFATLIASPSWGTGLSTLIGATVRVAIVATVAIGLVRLVIEARRGSSDAGTILFGAVAFAASGVFDIAASFGLGGVDWSSAMPLGAAVLLVSLTLVVARRTLRLLEAYRREIDRFERERGRMLRDLHDGIGGITTNIRLLSDMERARSDDGAANDTLQTISELSAEGLEQIRGFAQTLEEPSSWSQLAAELRRTATQTLEPHGFRLSFDRECEAASPPPGAVVRMAIWRVYREMLTNVAKYGDTREEVRIGLDVTRDAVALRIENARAAEARDRGVGEGRGLTNMGTRIEELGGRFDARFDDRARVALWLPITEESPTRGMVG